MKIREIEPLINDLVNPIAAFWVHNSGLFKQLAHIANNTPRVHASQSISNSAVARYLHLQLELVESIFLPINDAIVECIKANNNNNVVLDDSSIKFFKSSSTLQALTSIFMIKKPKYWISALLKLKKLLLQASSQYYQVIAVNTCRYPLLIPATVDDRLSTIGNTWTNRSVEEHD